MLEVHSLLMDMESRYILNDLYVTDYCVWTSCLARLDYEPQACKRFTSLLIDTESRYILNDLYIYRLL